jgi:hypothetical protein
MANGLLGLAGLEGWRWIFILEGMATVLMGVGVFFMLPDSPDHAAGRWLTIDEARFLRLTNIVTRGIKRERRVNADGKKEKVKWGVIGQVAKDWQIYLQAMIFASNAVPNYGLKFTMPQILKNSKSAPKDDCAISTYNEISGLHIHDCATHDRPTVCLRRHLRFGFISSSGSIHMADAFHC